VARRERGREARPCVRCDGAGEKVVLAFAYDAALVEAARAVPGRYFDREMRGNVFPFTRLPEVVALADAYGIGVAAEVRALVPAAARRAGAEAVRQGVPAGVGRDLGAGGGRVLREAAHFYLGYGLLPVPAWAAAADCYTA